VLDFANFTGDNARTTYDGVEDRRWSSTGRVLSDRMIERSTDTLCGLHRAQGDEECGFHGLASKPRSTVSSDLASKPMATVLVICHQNHSLGFFGLGLKIGSSGLVIWPIKSSQRFLSLCLKIKWAMVY
jgi:hypothetical protein